MSLNSIQLIRLLAVFIPLLFIIGFYCIIATRNLIRALIGLEILTKAVTLLLIAAGYLTGRTALSQGFVITLIMVEAVVVAVAAGIIVNTVHHTDSLDRHHLEDLKG
ncbi:MAG TPA: NADH-quinone oxidoreductase subunit K [Terriglobales bacterium]